MNAVQLYTANLIFVMGTLLFSYIAAGTNTHKVVVGVLCGLSIGATFYNFGPQPAFIVFILLATVIKVWAECRAHQPDIPEVGSVWRSHHVDYNEEWTVTQIFNQDTKDPFGNPVMVAYSDSNGKIYIKSIKQFLKGKVVQRIPPSPRPAASPRPPAFAAPHDPDHG